MKNTSTTLELPEGSKATIAGKNIDGKNYLVVEVENEEQELKEGDFVIVWDEYPQTAKIELFKEYNKYKVPDKVGTNYRNKTKTDNFWINAIKWDGTNGQYERVLQGEI